MVEFKQYIASEGRTEISPETLDAIIGRYGWFTTARIARAHRTGKSDSILSLATSKRVIPLLALQNINIEKLLADKSTEDVISKFLQLDNYRIVADESEVSIADNDIRMEAELDDEDDLVSEELAEVYLSQGLKSEAIAIYRKLSLLNPKKSIYFAELIEQIEKQ
jgi:TolB-like protein